MNYKENRGGFGNVYLDDWSDGARRASVGNVRPGPVLVVHDRVSMAYMGRPFASYLCLGVYPERFDRLGGSVGLPTEISFFGLPRPGLGKRGATRVRWRFGFRARRAVVVGRVVVVGPAQATSHPIRSHSVGQGTSHRSGRVSSALNGKEREFFAPPFHLPRSACPLLTTVPFSLSRRREKVFRHVFSPAAFFLFPSC